MKNVIFFISFMVSSSAFAGLRVYDCKLTDADVKATLVLYGAGGQIHRADWIPDAGLKTTKANLGAPTIMSDKSLQFSLFGFQDQGDYLFVPTEGANLAKNIQVYTIHDDDDNFVDRQDFTCLGYGQ